MVSKIGKMVTNSSWTYLVLDTSANNTRLLLQKEEDKELIIATNVVWTGEDKCYWGNGYYYGHDVKEAMKAFK